MLVAHGKLHISTDEGKEVWSVIIEERPKDLTLSNDTPATNATENSDKNIGLSSIKTD